MKTNNGDTNWGHALEEANRFASFDSDRTALGLQRFSAACLAQLDELKRRVTRQLSAEYGKSLGATLLGQAVSEADALAATTLFPSLFFPTLAEEKVRLAYAWSTRQRRIRERTMAFAE